MIFFLSEEKIRKKKKTPRLFFPDFEFSGEKNLLGVCFQFFKEAFRKLRHQNLARQIGLFMISIWNYEDGIFLTSWKVDPGPEGRQK